MWAQSERRIGTSLWEEGRQRTFKFEPLRICDSHVILFGMIKLRRVRLTGRVARMAHVKFIQNLTKREGVRPLRIYKPIYRWEGDNKMFGLELLIS